MNKEKIGEKNYDLIIVGAGPAGLTAAVYAGRYLLKTLVIGELDGGMISEAHEIHNFPTYKSITGMELAKRLIEQVRNLGVDITHETVEEIKGTDNNFSVITNNNAYKAKKIILAIGRKKKKLNVPGEKELLGKGVSYCATCDASFFKDSIVAVVGGSNSALTAALLLSEYAKKVYLIYRGIKFSKAEPAWVKQVESNDKIERVFSSNITEIKGENSVEEIVLDTGRTIKVDGVFIEIGSVPDNKLANQININLDNDYIAVDKSQETSVRGVFAAGDITNNPLKQAITAAAEGAIAAASAYHEIKSDNP